MKKTTVSALLLAFVSGLCMTAVALADTPSHTHAQGVADIKITNMSHSLLKVGKVHTFGPKDVEFTVKENTFSHPKHMGYEDKRSFVVKYEFDKNTIPPSHWGSSVTIKKLFKGKDGCFHYSRCSVHIIAGPGKATYGKHGRLCKHVQIKTSSGSGTITYLKAEYK